MRRRASLPPLLLALAVGSQDARGQMPELWRWIDPDGVARYTPDPDYVPAGQRGTLVRVEAGMAKAPEPAQELKPTAIFVPPGEPPLEADPFNAPAPARVESEIVAPVPLETAPRAAEPPPAPSEAPRSAPAARAAARPAPAVARSAAGTPPRAAAPASAQTGEVVPIAAIEAEEVSLDAAPLPAGPGAAAALEDTAVALDEAAASLLAAAPDADAALPVAAAPDADAGLPVAAPDADATPPVAAAPAQAVAPEASAAPTPETAPDAVGAAPPAPDLEVRRAELAAAIARDEEALKAHVASGEALADSPELREIAQRLPALRAELRALEAQPPAP